MSNDGRRLQRSPIVRWRDSVRDSPDPHLRAPEVAVVNTLASHMNGSQSCYPSVATIARESRLGERTVQKAISTLERLGYLTVHRSAGRKSNVYAIPTPQDVRGSTPQESASNGAPGAPEVVTTKKAGGAGQTPATCKNPDCGEFRGNGHHVDDCPFANEP